MHYRRYCMKCDESVENGPTINKRFCIKCKTKFHEQCIRCNKLYTSHSSLRKHIKRGCEETTAPSNSCSKCKKDFKNLSALTSHVKSCGTQLDLYARSSNNSCPNCAKPFKNLAAVKRHVRGFCRKQPGLGRTKFECEYSCPNCNRDFMKLCGLKYHMKFCGRDPNLSCKYCPYKTRSPFQLHQHSLTHRPNSTSAESNGCPIKTEGENNSILLT